MSDSPRDMLTEVSTPPTNAPLQFERVTKYFDDHRALDAATLAVAWTGAHSQPYPAKAVRFVLPVPPGGGTDILMRTIVPKLSIDLIPTAITEVTSATKLMRATGTRGIAIATSTVTAAKAARAAERPVNTSQAFRPNEPNTPAYAGMPIERLK